MFRIMGNKLGYGTFVAEEAILTQEQAEHNAKRLRSKAFQKNEQVSYFVQEYEEGRLGK